MFTTVIFDIAIFILPFPETQYFYVTVLVLICYVLDVISGIAILLDCSFGTGITFYDHSGTASSVLDYIFGIAI